MINVGIGKSVCSIVSASNSQIKCFLGQNAAGNYSLLVQIDGKGYANRNVSFNYDLNVISLSKIEGKSRKIK